MNYSIITKYLLIGLVLFTSCKKDFLDRTPQDQISSATFWTSEKDARLAVNGCYTLLASSAYDAIYYDGAADNAYCQYPWESNSTLISAGDITATLDQGYAYVGIRRFNYFLENIDKAPISDELKKRFIAEVRFLRAYEHFVLAQVFGAVPLVKKYVSETSEKFPVTSEAEVIQFVISELTAAAADLPLSYGGGAGNENGRITKGAALALKSRVNLFYGKWTEAATAAKEVMDLNQYDLFAVTELSADDMADDYSPFFSFASDLQTVKFYKGLRSYEKLFWNNSENKEIILEAQFIENSAYEQSSGIATFMLPGAVNGWSSITPTQSLVDSYWAADGTAFTAPTAATRATNYNNGAPTAAYFNEFKNRDTRLYATVLFPTNPWNALEAGYTFDWAKGGSNNSKTGYNFRKLVDPNYLNEWSAPQNYPLIRFAEVLLNYAEAKNEATGPDAGIFDALDKIRTRVGMPLVNRSTTQAQLRDLIRNERRIELAAEGFRFADIRRWNIAASAMKNIYDITNSLAQERKWEARYMKLPYPQTALDRNPLLKDAQTAKGY